MNMRERLFAQMGRNPLVLVPNWEFTYWETTLPEWHKQGLPQEIDTTVKGAHGGTAGVIGYIRNHNRNLALSRTRANA